MAAVLLHRGVAVLEHDGKAAFVRELARRAEVEQLDLLSDQHDIVGADVAVDQTLGVDLPQRTEHGHQQAYRVVGRNVAHLLEIALERDAVEVFHDDVDGAVLLEEIAHRHDACLVGEFGEGAGFSQKVLTAF